MDEVKKVTDYATVKTMGKEDAKAAGLYQNISNQATGHIACKAVIFSSLSVFYINAQSVCIRVGGKDQIRGIFQCAAF